MKTNSRAFVIPAVYFVVVGVLAVGGWAYTKLTEPGRNKKVADQVAAQTAIADAQAKANKDKADAVAAATQAAAEANAKEREQEKKVRQNASGFTEGAKIAIQADPAPSQADLVALSLLEGATQALGEPLTDSQRKVWVSTVAGLIAKNSASEAQVAALKQQATADRAALDAITAHAQAADATAQTLAVKLDQQAKILADTTGKASTLAEQNAQWADGAITLWGRIKALGVLAVILVMVIVVVAIKLFGVNELATDAVAFGEHLKTFVEDGEKKVESWWSDDPKARKLFNKYKTKLRL
jgi:hypothetical protein